jgi:lysylphosphatidylglycerol synthetase-like protein (DUF2156 family)
MISTQSALVGFFTGVILTLAWVIFTDGQLQSNDRFIAINVIPPILATLSGIMINIVSFSNNNVSVKVWIFCWFTLQVVCVGWSIFIITTVYTPEDNYPGVTILLQTTLTTMASLIFFLGHQNLTTNEAEYI